jgi:REP element-mobilizing transposase RayT
MPNHVHVMFRPHSAMVERIVQTWKRVSVRKINERLGRAGAVWARDYFDRAIRDEVHRAKARRYIRNNPVKAGLCREPADWRWSSAWEEREERRL